MKRLLTGSALVAGLAFSGPIHAEGNKARGETVQHSEPSRAERASAISGLSQQQVKDLQRELAARGLYQGSIDGIPGKKTEAALQNFQTQQGLTVGSLDAKTRDALGLEWNQASGERQTMTGREAQSPTKQPVRGNDGTSPAERRNTAGSEVSTRPAREPASNGIELSSLGTERVKQIQQHLQRDGYYQGEIDGVAGAQTRAALKRYFQRQAELVEQGRMNESAVGWFEKK